MATTATVVTAGLIGPGIAAAALAGALGLGLAALATRGRGGGYGGHGGHGGGYGHHGRKKRSIGDEKTKQKRIDGILQLIREEDITG